MLVASMGIERCFLIGEQIIGVGERKVEFFLCVHCMLHNALDGTCRILNNGAVRWVDSRFVSCQLLLQCTDTYII